MQSQLVCSGCRTILMYPRGAPNVRCALCNTVTPAQSTGSEMDQIICGCCHTLLMYSRGATSVRCLCCQTVNLTNATPVSSQYSTVRCGNCQMTLMYPFGAPSVKCAVCHYITNVGTTNGSVSSSLHRQNGVLSSSSPTACVPVSQTQTVVVENPMSFDGSGKLVSNVVVGVTTDKK
ncbi:protein LSD1 [Amaranthus tricolor]|uniref:protein LSD1 n=1 Tax=Amaranthus tricolor TaxID=29722 RepID=UPI00258C2965|nr:protein LSD1 [Amaranthus tricolor]XP_057544820.1 protein LSD1 [Amaranthus tricolor]